MRVEEMTREQLEDAVRKLPQTADGVVVLYNDTVWILCKLSNGAYHILATNAGYAFYSRFTPECWIDIYSTKEAAEAARSKR